MWNQLDEEWRWKNLLIVLSCPRWTILIQDITEGNLPNTGMQDVSFHIHPEIQCWAYSLLCNLRIFYTLNPL